MFWPQMSIKRIFPSSAPSYARSFVARQALALNPERFYVPFAGRFDTVDAFVRYGGAPAAVLASDTSLFPSVIGYLADDSKSLADLGIRLHGPIQPLSDDPLAIAAATALTLKYAQISPSTRYGQSLRRELLTNAPQYLEGIAQHLAALVDTIRGVRYNVRDFQSVLEEAEGDADGLLYINVPLPESKRERRAQAELISWNAPAVQKFTRRHLAELLDRLLVARCRVLVYVRGPREKTAPGWRVVYAQPRTVKRPERIDYIIANFDADVYAHAATKPIRPPRIFPVYNDEEITENSVVQVVKVDRDTALYYRDLFVHKLGSTTAERFFLLLIDGRVVSAFGISFRDLLLGRSEYVGEAFGITKTSQRYKMLGKLFMLCLTSGEMKRIFMSLFRLWLKEPRGIRTTSITTHPEGKTDRSVMKLVHRERLPTGPYRLIYQADFRDDTFQDCLRRWLANWGHKRR